MLLAVGNGREGQLLLAALVARELSLACHERGAQTFAVDDIGLANVALLPRFPETSPAAPRRRNAASNHLALALTIWSWSVATITCLIFLGTDLTWSIKAGRASAAMTFCSDLSVQDAAQRGVQTRPFAHKISGGWREKPERLYDFDEHIKANCC
jgi:hypothetical protein